MNLRDLVKDLFGWDEEKAQQVFNLGKPIPRSSLAAYYLELFGNPERRPSGETAMVYYYDRGQRGSLVWKRNLRPGEPIVIDPSDEDPDSPRSILYHIRRRMVEVHKVYGPRTPEAVVDIDPGDDVPHEHTKRAAKLVRDAFNHLGFDATIVYTGGRGYHVVADLGKEVGIGLARDIASRAANLASYALEKSGIPSRVGGAGPPARGEIHLDLAPMKAKGSRRIPGSLNAQTGRVATEVPPEIFDIFDPESTEFVPL